MKFHYDLSGAQQICMDIPVYGNGSAFLEGAILMRGATPATDSGFAVIGAGTYAGVLGVIKEPHAAVSAGADSKQDGTAYGLRKILINPFAVYLAEHTGALVIDSVTTVTVSVTSAEDNVDGGWMLGNDGMLQYIVGANTSSRTTKSASGWTSANTFIHIQPLFHAINELSADATKLSATLATTDGKIRTLQNYIKAVGLPFQPLNPTKHSGLTLTSAKAYSDIIFTDHAFGING